MSTRKTSSKNKPKNPDHASRPNPTRVQIVDMVMSMAAQRGWAAVEFDDVAASMRLSPMQLEKFCPDKQGFIKLLAQEVADLYAENIPSSDVQENVHDRLFEATMALFDIMSPWKSGISSIIKSWPKQDLFVPLHASRFLIKLSALILDKSRIAANPLRNAGLSFVLLSVLRTWARDKSEDLGSTMAILNQRLTQAAQFAETLRPLCRKTTESNATV